MKKYIFLAFIFVFCLFNQELIYNEIPISKIVSTFANNLYENTQAVSNQLIEVLDYEIYDDYIKVIPINSKCILPCDGIITKVSENEIQMNSHDFTYKISGIKPKYFLYQYYNKGMTLGISNEYYIYGDNILNICSKFEINYEAI